MKEIASCIQRTTIQPGCQNFNKDLRMDVLTNLTKNICNGQGLEGT